MIKTSIWILTIVGLLPASLFAIGHIISMISFARLPKEPSQPGTVSFIGDVSIAVGSASKLHLSTHIWPAVLVLAGTLGVLVGLLFLVPRQPDRVRSGGFSRVELYIDRLLRSHREFASVIVATPDGQYALLVIRQAGQTVLSMSAERTKNEGEELRRREFFKRRGMTPAREYSSSNGGVADATRNFEFQLSGDARAVATLCVSVFSELFGVTDQHGLEFTTDGL